MQGKICGRVTEALNQRLMELGCSEVAAVKIRGEIINLISSSNKNTVVHDLNNYANRYFWHCPTSTSAEQAILLGHTYLETYFVDFLIHALPAIVGIESNCGGLDGHVY